MQPIKLIAVLLSASTLSGAVPNLGCFWNGSAVTTTCTNVSGGISCAIPAPSNGIYRYSPQPPTLPSTVTLTPTWGTLAGNSFFGIGFANYTGTPGSFCTGGCLTKNETIVVDATNTAINVLVVQWSAPYTFVGVVASASVALTSGNQIFFKIDHSSGNLNYWYSLTSTFPGTPFYTESDTSFFSGGSPPNVTVFFMRSDSAGSSAETMLISDWSPFACLIQSSFPIIQ